MNAYYRALRAAYHYCNPQGAWNFQWEHWESLSLLELQQWANGLISQTCSQSQDLFLDSQGSTDSVRLSHYDKLNRMAWQLVEMEEAHGLRCIFSEEAEYPRGFTSVETAPKVLQVMGELPKTPGLAVVGSRKPRSELKPVLEDTLNPWAQTFGDHIISGGARGVDSWAQSIAIGIQVPAVVWVPSGLLKLYPRELGEWKDAVVAGGGGYVSPFAPWQEMRNHHFHIRNELIAAHALGLLVASATLRSGSMVTGKYAQYMDRPLAAIPGNPENPTAQGCLRLISEGAEIISNSKDLIAFWSAALSRVRGHFSLEAGEARSFSIEYTGEVLRPLPTDAPEEGIHTHPVQFPRPIS